MGIYLRYAAALIILATFSDSYASVRKNVSMPSKQSVIDNPSRSFQTPNGSAAYFGQDHVDYHTAGNRFKPGDSPGTPKQKITLKPTLTANPSSVAKAAVKSLKGGGLGGAALGVATNAILQAVDAVMEQGSVHVPGFKEVESSDPSSYKWRRQTQPTTDLYTSPAQACQSGPQPGVFDNVQFSSSTSFKCYYYFPEFDYVGSGALVVRSGVSCPAGSNYDSQKGVCLISALVPASEADFNLMEEFAKAKDSDFVRDLIKETCANSLNPAACIDQMTEWGQLSGPSSSTGPAQTTTSVTTNPDGTTSNTATTTQNKYNYTYGDNYYNYSTTTTTTTTKDGQTTTTETSDGLPTDEPTSEENPEESEESYVYEDSQMPEVPSFYEQQYPDGLAGVWDNASAQVNNSQFIQFLNGFVPSFSGSCPSFALSFNIASWASYGSIGFASLCYVFDFIKVILLVTALFTFRAITFGG